MERVIESFETRVLGGFVEPPTHDSDETSFLHSLAVHDVCGLQGKVNRFSGCNLEKLKGDLVF